MDEFLKSDITQARNERVQFFQMLERFHAEIISFQTRYHSFCQKRDDDIRFISTNASNARSALKEKFEKEINQIHHDRDITIAKLDKDLDQARNHRRQQESAADKEYSDWEVKRADAMQSKGRAFQDRNDADQLALSQILALYQDVVDTVSDKRFQKLTAGVSADDCNSQHTAESFISADIISELNDIKNKVLTIQQSLPQKALDLLIKRVETHCRQAEQIQLNARAGVRFLQGQRVIEKQKLGRQFEADKISHRAMRDKKKASYTADYQKIETSIRAQIGSTQSTSAKREKTVSSDYASQQNAMLAAQARERQSVDTKWVQESQKECQQFYARMEEVFPAVQMQKAFAKAFEIQMDPQFHTNWATNTPYSSISSYEAFRNVPIGVAYIDTTAKNWFTGEGAGAVKALLQARYSYMFQRQKSGDKVVANLDLLQVPYKFSLESGENIFVSAPENYRDRAEYYVQAVAMRLLWSAPAGQSQFLLADNAAIGSFSNFASLDPAGDNASGLTTVKSIIEGEQICSNATEIRQKILDNETRYNSSAGQMGAVTSLREYNLKHLLSQRSFIIALLQKFPAGLDGETLASLRKLGENCGKWGFSMLLTGSDKELNSIDKKLAPSVAELIKGCTCIQMVDPTWFVVRKSQLGMELGARVFLYPQPNPATRDRMKEHLRAEMIKASKKTIDFEKAKDIMPSRETMFSASARDGIVVPIGYWDGGAPCNLIFDDSRVHTIINGDTGSGKTNLLHVVLTNVMLRYDPDEVEIFLIDFKHGTECRRYTRYNLPSFRSINLCNEPEYALKILRELKQVVNDRSKMFSDATNNLSSYIKNTGNKMSRILLIVDELFQLVKDAELTANSTIKDQIISIIREIAIQGRAYGIHMIISGQNLPEIQEIQTIKESCETRVALRCSEEQVAELMNQEAADQMRLINTLDKGACVIRLGKSEKPKIEHTAYVEPDRQHIQILERIHTHYIDLKRYTRAKIMITDVQSNLNNIYQRFLARNDLSQINLNEFYFGEFLSVNASGAISLTQSNLWIAGGSSEKADEAGRSIVFFSLLSLVMQKAKESSIAIYFCNGGTNAQYPLGGEGDRAGELALSLREAIQYVTGEEMPGFLVNAYQALQERMNGNAERTPIWIMLQKPEDSVFNNAQNYQLLQELLLHGPSVGMRCIIWTKNVQQAIQMQINQLPFEQKLALAMDANLCAQVLGAKPATEPSNYYVTTVRGSTTDRMRVFDLPSSDWTEKMIVKLKSEE